MKVLVKTKNLSHTDWLRYRTMGIGGSDVSVIAGINPYRSVYQIWLEKTGQTEPAERDNEYTHFGTILEPVVRKEFTARTGLKVRQKHMILQSEEHPFMLANLDGVINLDGKMCIFEAKTASAYKLDDWQSDIPPEYMLQVQHYMAVTGAAKTYIAVLKEAALPLNIMTFSAITVYTAVIEKKMIITTTFANTAVCSVFLMKKS